MIIGLTGGIGSGKSSVAKMFAARGAVIIDTDAIAREVVKPPSPVLDAIRYEFGESVMTPEGTLDREALARIVFADGRQRELLNQLIHPAIRARGLELMKQQPPEAIVVVVVPLLFESEFDKECDTVVTVIADPDLRQTRVSARDYVSEADVAARINAQLTDDEYARRAKHVIHNDHDLAHLEQQVEKIWQDLRTM